MLVILKSLLEPKTKYHWKCTGDGFELGPSGKMADSSRDISREVVELPKKLGWLALSLSKIVYPKLSGCPETRRENE